MIAWLARHLKRIAGPPAPFQIVNENDEAIYRPIDRGLVRRLLGCLAPCRRAYALGISLGVVMVLLEMLSPLYMRWLIDWTTGVLSAGGAVEMRRGVWGVVGIVGLWALTLSVALVLQRTTLLIMTGAGERVQFELRRRIFEHLQRLSMSYYDRTKLGRIISRCTSDLNGLREINVWGIDTVAKNALMMLFAAGMLIYNDWRLFVAVVWLGPVLLLINQVYRRRISVAYQVMREGYTRVSTNLAENITGVRIVTAFNRQSHNLGVFNALQDQNTRNVDQAARINGLYWPALQLVGFAGRAAIMLVGGYLVATGRTPAGIGSVVAAFLYWEWFMGPILGFGNFHNQLLMALAGAERIFNLLDTKPEVTDRPDAIELPPIRGHVRFEHVTFGYRPERPVLFDVDFEAEPGQMIALVGATGSGKSSIVSLLARFYVPQCGRVLVDGYDIAHVRGDSLHHQMGLVLQVNFLFSGTVLDNIRYARPTASEQDVMDAARAVGSYEALAGLASGFATQVGERGASLSLGQRQLICFTRAFLADPRILLLDEATSAVDTVTELTLQTCLARLLAGRTTFVVAHRLSTIQRADCILVIDKGCIIERGSHAELLAKDGRYARLHEQFVLASE